MKIKDVASIGNPVSNLARSFYQDGLGLKLFDAHEMPGDRWWLEYAIAGTAIVLHQNKTNPA